MSKPKTAKHFLDNLNSEYSKLHKAYEEAFWMSYMGDHSYDKKMSDAQYLRDAFRGDVTLKRQTEVWIKSSKGKTRNRLKIWVNFFKIFQTPPEALPIREKVAELEALIAKKKTTRKEGYKDPKTGKFVEASENRMRHIIRGHPDEAVRKAVFDAMEKLPLDTIDEYIKVIKFRNEFARKLGHADFYAYKARIDENMSKKELFSIFEKIYQRTKYAFKDVRKLEREKPGLRKPWNFGYMMTGDLTSEEDQYYPFKNALSYWGRSFAALGVDLKGGTIKMDLLDRKGKHNNGFCHYPDLVQFRKGKRIPASSGIASNTVLGQPGAGAHDIHVLFHEGGHAADRLNSMQPDACINHEYPPSTVSWAETHSMFMDALYYSIEWRTRYAKNEKGESYPFSLFERKLRATNLLRPLNLMYIILVVMFEKEVYETKNLNERKLISIAKKVNRKYNDRSVDSISILNLPHLYSWESSAYYHGYGLAELSVAQWRAYFIKKYGYIVDNPNVGKELTKMWSYSSLFSNKKLIRMATGKPLSADAFINDVTTPIEKMLDHANKRIIRMKSVPIHKGPINLGGKIIMVHGKKRIADNSKSFEDMDMKYRKWLKTVK